MARYIEIERGNKFISAWELGRKIGALLRPTPDTPPLLAELRKKIAQEEPQHYRLEELTDGDVMYLRRIWAGLDIPDALNMTPEQWAECKAAFHAAPDRPAWDLHAGFRNYAQEAKSAQIGIANKHIRAMNGLISAGRMRAYDADLAPVPSVDGWGTQIPVDDARTYLADRLLLARCRAPTAGNLPKRGAREGTRWHLAHGGTSAASFPDRPVHIRCVRAGAVKVGARQ